MNCEATDRAGVRHIAYETLGSTNAEALARARAGERGPLWITAASQSAGRGRRGSAWVSPPGNLYATLLLSEPSPPEAGAATVVCRRAGAARRAVATARRSSGRCCKVKWPNDLLLGRRQARRHPDRRRERSGVCASPSVSASIAPRIRDDTAYPATDLAARRRAGRRLRLLLAALSAAMQRRLAQWQRGQGFAVDPRRLAGRAAGLGEDIRVRLPERELSRPLSRASTRRAACWCSSPSGAGDRHRRRSLRLGRDLIMAQRETGTGVRAARRRRRDRHEPVDLRAGRRRARAPGSRSISACRLPPKSNCPASI